MLGPFVSSYTFKSISIVMLIAFCDFEKSGCRIGRNSVYGQHTVGKLQKANEIAKAYAD